MKIFVYSVLGSTKHNISTLQKIICTHENIRDTIISSRKGNISKLERNEKEKYSQFRIFEYEELELNTMLGAF